LLALTPKQILESIFRGTMPPGAKKKVKLNFDKLAVTRFSQTLENSVHLCSRNKTAILAKVANFVVSVYR